VKSAFELCIDAKNELSSLLPGDTFVVRDLFKGYVWNKIERSVRLKVGILFFEEAKKMEKIIEIRKKNSSNQKVYRKK